MLESSAERLRRDADPPSAAEPEGHQPRLAWLRDLPARHKLLFCDAPGEAQTIDWPAVGIALAYHSMEIEL